MVAKCAQSGATAARAFMDRKPIISGLLAEGETMLVMCEDGADPAPVIADLVTAAHHYAFWCGLGVVFAEGIAIVQGQDTFDVQRAVAAQSAFYRTIEKDEGQPAEIDYALGGLKIVSSLDVSPHGPKGRNILVADLHDLIEDDAKAFDGASLVNALSELRSAAHDHRTASIGIVYACQECVGPYESALLHDSDVVVRLHRDMIQIVRAPRRSPALPKLIALRLHAVDINEGKASRGRNIGTVVEFDDTVVGGGFTNE